MKIKQVVVTGQHQVELQNTELDKNNTIENSGAGKLFELSGVVKHNIIFYGIMR